MSEKTNAHLSLASILDKDADAEELSQDAWPDEEEKAEGWDEEEANIAKEGYCIECEGTPTSFSERCLELISPLLQTNRPRFAAKLARTSIARFASPHNTVKGPGGNTSRSH